MITADTNLARLLDEHPRLVEVLAARHEYFARVRNGLPRRVMAPRVTVGQVADLAGVSVADLVVTLRRAIGELEDCATTAGTPASTATSEPRPAELEHLRAVEADVRDDIRRGKEPFARIMAASKALGPAEALMVRAPFEPVPLYDVLRRRGFVHWTEQRAPDDWRVWFYRGTAPVPVNLVFTAADAPTLDVRGLEPPLPMVRVLERLEVLEPGGVLTVLHERRPLFLYPQLDERGFQHETDETEPGLVRIVIRRAQS